MTYHHMLTFVIDITNNNSFFTVFIDHRMNPFISFKNDGWLNKCQMNDKKIFDQFEQTLTSRPSAVVSSKVTPGWNCTVNVLIELSVLNVHLPFSSKITRRGFMPLAVIRSMKPTPSSFMYASKFSPSTWFFKWNESMINRIEILRSPNCLLEHRHLLLEPFAVK